MKIMKIKKPLESLILTVRGHKVLMDSDLAEIYGVPTKVFNQAVKRNAERFPEDFCFRLTLDEAEAVLRSRSQFVTTSFFSFSVKRNRKSSGKRLMLRLMA